MFEKAQPVPRDISGEELDDQLLVGSHDHAPARTGNGPSGHEHCGHGYSGGALRALEWSELTAKLNAARDLRRVLRRDTRLNIEQSAASFGDAAATYFRALEHDERNVNPVALEPRKASGAIVDKSHEGATTGDVRDN